MRGEHDQKIESNTEERIVVGVVTADAKRKQHGRRAGGAGNNSLSFSLVRKRTSGSVIEERRDRHHLERYYHLGHRCNRPYRHLGDDRGIDSNQTQA